MTQIRVYVRSDCGRIQCLGFQDWDTIPQAVDYYHPDFTPEPETETLMGWADSSVQWWGNVGFAVVEN